MTVDFALIGAAGFVAVRHMRAIAATGNRLVAALDPNDSVGVIDQHFPDAHFFVEFERFDRHVDKLRRKGAPVRYVSICSPNYLHDAHIRLALRVGAHAICEKPLVINPWNLDGLQELEEETGKRIYTVLQLRLHPALVEFRERLRAHPGKRHVVQLAYLTARGRWYDVSWKGVDERSGGIVTNIGIHFFDLLVWLFGPVQSAAVHLREAKRAAGTLVLADADVRWYLSAESVDLPFAPEPGKRTTFRSITVDGEQLEFSEGFTDLHTRVYEEVLQGRGFGMAEARPSIELSHRIRHTPLSNQASAAVLRAAVMPAAQSVVQG